MKNPNGTLWGSAANIQPGNKKNQSTGFRRINEKFLTSPSGFIFIKAGMQSPTCRKKYKTLVKNMNQNSKV